MKKVWTISLTGITAALISLISCRPDPATDAAPDADQTIVFKIPDGWPQPVYNFVNNQLTREGFELGRKLFYDPRLSRDNTISCNSCHEQYAAFSHLDHTVSHGIDGRLGTRNGPGIFNLAWHPAFFWDGGVNNLESQPINPIENHVEMDMTVPEVVTKLQADPAYGASFKKAFGDTVISSQRIFKSLAQFMGAMVSANAKYDKHQRGADGGMFTQQEQHGLVLFRQHCASCHKEPLFSDFSYRNNGLAPNPAYNDSGRAHITGLAKDSYRFMVPSLRNVELTRPYMHDGRFSTLEAAVDHYRTGITGAPTLDSSLRQGLPMTDADRNDIVAFLKTLTDKDFIADKRFSQP